MNEINISKNEFENTFIINIIAKINTSAKIILIEMINKDLE